MGTWGYAPLDNDAALEIQYIWDTYVAERLANGEWSAEDVTRYFVESRWGDAVNYGDNITNSEILAIVEIFRAKNLGVDRTLKKIAEDASNRELIDAELQRWENPQRRKEEVLKLLEFVGGKIRKPKRAKVFRDRCIAYKNRAVAERELMKLTRFGRKLMFGYELRSKDDLKKSVPSFIRTLDRFVNHGTWEKDSNITIEAVSQRLMMIAYYLGMSLGYSEGKIRQLILDAKWEKSSAKK